MTLCLAGEKREIIAWWKQKYNFVRNWAKLMLYFWKETVSLFPPTYAALLPSTSAYRIQLHPFWGALNLLHKAILVIITADEYPACCVCSLLPDLAEQTEVPNDYLISPRQAVGACRRLGKERWQRQGHYFFSWALRTSSLPRKHTFTKMLPG